MREEKHAQCMVCLVSCGLLATVENGKVVDVQGDPDSLTQGYICPKGKLGAIEFLYHPDRVNYPLKRVGAKGEGKWERISWEQGIAEVAQKLDQIRKESGPEAVIIHSGHGESPHDGIAAYGRFNNYFQTPNLIVSGAYDCWLPKFTGHLAVIGWIMPDSDIVPGVTKSIILWGNHPSESHFGGAFWVTIQAAKQAGAKLIVIDPRLTEEAGEADLWLQIRPGSDGALGMAMANVIIGEELYDKDFVTKWCTGFEELKAKVKDMTPEKAEEITWVPAEKIREAARIYATNSPGANVWGIALSQQGRATTSNTYFHIALQVITGNIDKVGAGMMGWGYPNVRHDIINAYEELPLEQRKKAVGYEEFPFLAHKALTDYEKLLKRTYNFTFPSNGWVAESHGALIWRQILSGKPYPLRAMINQGGHIFGSHANTRLVHEALKKLELSVVVDPFMTPQAELADYVFPPACTFERANLADGWGMAPIVGAVEKAVEPLYERKHDYEFWSALANALNLPGDWPEKAVEIYQKMLDPAGLNFEELANSENRYRVMSAEEKKYEKYGFATQSGKIELFPSLAQRMGRDPIPVFEEAPAWSPVSTPELLEEFPLVLTTGARNIYYFFSQNRQLPSVRSRDPWPHVQIHPETARELGIGDGQWVYIETPKGRIRQLAKYDSSIHPRVVNAEFDWWYPEEPGEEPFLHGLYKSNVNVMLDDDPATCSTWTGSDSRRAALCKVYPVPDYTHVPSYANR